MADSQGDCNNFTFGTGGNSGNKTDKQIKGFGYYETMWRLGGWCRFMERKWLEWLRRCTHEYDQYKNDRY
ncbi:hypothetical protein NW754_011976 [Fusarium falciforme]|nr:hypothetical protein NW754_011976 [Fusarium falciforme]